MTAAAAGGPPAAGDSRGSQPAAGSGGPAAAGAPKPSTPGAGQEPAKDRQDGQPQAQPTAGGEGGAETPPPPQSGPGAESYEATGQLGQGSQRRGLLQNAVANVEGDMVGGDKYVVVLGGHKRRLRVLSPLIAERVRFAYSASADLPDARDALTRQRLLILRSAPGYGKSAMAVRLLLGACRGAVYHLDSGVDFASLAEQLENDSGVIERGVGFLLERPEDIGNLGRETYEKVQGALSQADAWMVVTVTDGELSDGELLVGVRDLTDAPQPLEVVRAHLRWRLGERDADRLLAREDVRDVIAELVGGVPACRQAGDLAAAMVEQYDLHGGVDLNRLREHRARLEAEDFEIWAESLPDAGARSFALALAVLNGLPQEDVAQAARSLRERLEDDGPYLRAPGPDGRPVRSKDLFETPRRRQLQLLRAQERDKPGGEPGTIIEYKDPGYARRVILHAWTQYEIQGELLHWLDDLVVHPAEQVRVYAAASGLGVLAAEAYRYMERRVLGPWARSDSALRRTAVAYALSVACQNPWVREQATALVGGWYADERPQVRAAAARVHGLGAVSGRPVEELARLFAVDSVTVAVAVGCALADLVADDPDAAGSVLPMLQDRTGDHRSGRAAVLAFLIVAAQVVVETKDVDPGAAVPEWPTLLYLAHRRPELRDSFVWLWRAALNESFFHDEAEQVVGDWAKLAERDSELREMLRLLVGAIAHGDQRSGRILRSCADDWVHPDRIVGLPLTAAMVRAQLDLEGV
ncbi:hypothetical protein RFN57_24625 [Streptomyces violaceochromogenes]|uniref:Uncharacterized protein n=1 Tax=Streptomyces violaceochromogenes TaxID=67377 RepID=A0ABU6M1E0_9ACTN|nr:hypothetical protein [Streptomyces violaceochromogenes]MEC7055443.1 hypothetical protein [Streptomyces violaceochromogenes]GHC73313.1 hypothetical protein GCM10010309_43010 [Streptomyces violaceochromogenes]